MTWERFHTPVGRQYALAMGSYDVPQVGPVIVSLETYRFGLTNESLTTLASARRADGKALDSVDHERVAQYLQSIAVI